MREGKTSKMNSTKVQNPRHKMQVALLAEPKTPLESSEFIALARKCGGHEALLYVSSAIRYTCAYKFTARVQSRA